MCGGVGRSGSPTPSEITSTPCSRLAASLRSSSANRYGGNASMRFAIRTLEEPLGGEPGLVERRLEHPLGRADEEDLVLGPLNDQGPTGEAHLGASRHETGLVGG